MVYKIELSKHNYGQNQLLENVKLYVTVGLAQVFPYPEHGPLHT